MQQQVDNKNNLMLVNIIEETADTKSFFFKPLFSESLQFKPGQFINIGVEIEQKIYYRAYSISSLPGDDFIQLTIKRVTGGLVSNWMIDNLKIGDNILFHSIAGQFNIIDCPIKENIVLVSAGCGITPMMSMAKSLLAGQQASIESIKFIHYARDINNIIYHDEILALSHKYALFQPTIYLSHFTHVPENPVYQLKSPENEGLKSHICSQQQNTSVFLCGSDKFMTMVERLLVDLAFDMTHFYQESFTPRGEVLLQSGSMVEACEASQVCEVSVPEFNFTEQIHKGTLLLDVLQGGNLPIIAACRSGLCGSCKCKVEQGHVELTSDPVANGLLTQDELDAGYTLACSSIILDDINISLKS